MISWLVCIVLRSGATQRQPPRTGIEQQTLRLRVSQRIRCLSVAPEH